MPKFQRSRITYNLYTKKKKRIQLDLFVGYCFVFVAFIYISLFGIYQLGGIDWGAFSIGYLTILIPIWLVDGMKGFFESFTRRSYRSSSEDLTKVTVVIACKDGEEVIGPTLKSLVKRFKRSQIIVASNGSTDATCMIAKGYGVIVLDIKKPLGKVRAINYALRYVKTPYVLLLDDDTLVEGALIPTGLLDEGYDGVAFRVLVVVSNWVSKLQMYEYRKSTDIGKRYHNDKASVQNISGAIGLFNLKQLKRQIRLHSGEFSGEDLQRTMLIHLAQDARGVVLTDSTVYTNPPATIHNLFKQRVYGWYPGLYANFKNYIKVMTRDVMPFPLRYDAFHNIFLVMLLDVVRFLSLPILIFYPWYFLVMYSCYLIFETVTYYRSGSKEPFWVVLVYPLYGLFNFVTRAAAFAVFIYRRLAVKVGDKEFLDDYRGTKSKHKWVSIGLTIGFVTAFSGLNIIIYYIKPIINFGF